MKNKGLDQVSTVEESPSASPANYEQVVNRPMVWWLKIPEFVWRCDEGEYIQFAGYEGFQFAIVCRNSHDAVWTVTEITSGSAVCGSFQYRHEAVIAAQTTLLKKTPEQTKAAMARDMSHPRWTPPPPITTHIQAVAKPVGTSEQTPETNSKQNKGTK